MTRFLGFRWLLVICILWASAVLDKAWANSIHLNFLSAFGNAFASGQSWQSLNEQDVKDAVADIVTDLYDPFGVTVSTSSGDIEVKIGIYADGAWGKAVSGLGSYIADEPLALLDTNLLAGTADLQGGGATLSRVSNAIGIICAHEIVHLFNLYHAYAYEAFDPLISGALYGDSYPKEPGPEMPIVAKADSANAKYRVMGTPYYGHLTLDDIAGGGQTFTPRSTNTIAFAVQGGVDVDINMAWGIPGATLEQQQDFTIGSGKTLIIAAAGYAHDLNEQGITINGDLVVAGTLTPDIAVKSSSATKGYYGTVQLAIDNASSNDTVSVGTPTLPVTTYSGNLEMASGVHMNGRGSGIAAMFGTVDFTSVSNIKVKNIRFLDTVTLYAGSNIEFTDCEFHDSFDNNYSVSVTNTHPVFFNGCDFWASQDGLILNNADPFVDECHFHGNSRYGINATNGSEPDVVSANHFYENNTYDIRADSDCDDVYATDNYWNPTPPNVDHESGSAQIIVTGWQAHKPAALAGSQGLRRQARALLREGELREALEAYRELVSEYPHSHDAFLALGHIASAYTQLGEEAEGIRYLEGVVRSRLDGALEARALFHTIPLLVSAGRLGEAAARADAVVARYPDTPTERHALLNQGFILRAQGDAAGGRAVFEALLARHPGSAEASIAHRFVQAGVGEVAEVAEKEDAGIESGLVLWRNFPNPFNPSTMLAFGLSEAAVVDVVIYNALGQEVRRLLSGVSMSAGPHQVAWDGRDGQGRVVSSGVYLYRIQAGSFEGVQRMVMVK